MAERVKGLATNHDDPRSMPGLMQWEERNDSHSFTVLRPPLTSCGLHACVDTQEMNKHNKKGFELLHLSKKRTGKVPPAKCGQC